MLDYFLFLILLIAALSHAICHSILKHGKNTLVILGFICLFKTIIFAPLVFLASFPIPYFWSLIIISAFLYGFDASALNAEISK